MTPTKKTYELSIAGVSFKLKTFQSEETVQELAELVDEKIAQAMAATKSGSLQNSAVIAALNIAEELILLKRMARSELERLEKKAVQLSSDIKDLGLPKQNILLKEPIDTALIS